MTKLLEKLVSFGRDRRGNIGLLAAASTPILVFSLALGVDFGHLTLERRALQQTADLAAIVAASDINGANASVLNYFATNNKNLAIREGDKLITANGTVAYNNGIGLQNLDGYAILTKGRYIADSAIPVANRFVANATPYDTVAVTTMAKTQLFFASSFATAPQIYATSKATMQKAAAFSIGSRLASLNEGILNQVLGSLLGTKLTLTAMDYNSLLDANVDAFKFSDTLATELNLTAATYDQVLNTQMTYGTFLSALSKTPGLPVNVAGIVTRLKNSLNTTKIYLSLGEILNLEPYKSRTVGSASTLSVNASVFDLINAAAIAANGSKQLAIDLGATIPGLAAVKLNLAIGEPPVGTPSLAAGMQGSIVRTAQTRASLLTTVDGLQALLGLQVQVPIYVEVATAEAALSDITCYGGAKNNASVKVSAVPGVAEIALGNVDTSAFDNFGSTPRVDRATIVNSLLLKVTALGHADIDNMTAQTVSFLPAEIQAGKIKTISTKDTLTSLTTSLLGNLDLDIKILFITLGTPQAVQQALANTLATITQPVDNLLYNTLLVLGIRIGEADIRVTGVTCQRPVLVQ